MGVYINLFLLFYADNTVIIAENVDSIQRALDVFTLYCNEWKLSVNTSKSKIVIFRGFEKLEDIKQVHLTFCKIIFCVKKSTPKFMIHGELGWFPLKYKIYSRIINYMKRNIESKEQKLSVIIYFFKLFSMYKKIIFISRWIVIGKHSQFP